MGSHEGVMTLRPPLFNGSNLLFWKIRKKSYLQSLSAEVWAIVEEGYRYPTIIPTNAAKRKKYEINTKAVNVSLGSLSKSEFLKVM